MNKVQMLMDGCVQFSDRLVQNFLKIHGADAKAAVAGSADLDQLRSHVDKSRPVHEPS